MLLPYYNLPRQLCPLINEESVVKAKSFPASHRPRVTESWPVTDCFTPDTLLSTLPSTCITSLDRNLAFLNAKLP